MKRTWLLIPAFSGFVLAVAAAQSVPTGDELFIRFGNATSRATANFQSADAIEVRLRQKGSTLHPQLSSLRVQIEAALGAAQSALAANDEAAAATAMIRAEALIDRFARRLGN